MTLRELRPGQSARIEEVDARQPGVIRLIVDGTLQLDGMLESKGTGGGNAASSGESVRAVAELAKQARRDGRPAAEDAVLRDRLVQLWIQEEGLRLGGQRRRVAGLQPDRPLALALMNKLV